MKKLVLVAMLLVVTVASTGCSSRRFRLWDRWNQWGDACGECESCCGGGVPIDGTNGMYLPPAGAYPGPAEYVTPAP